MLATYSGCHLKSYISYFYLFSDFEASVKIPSTTYRNSVFTHRIGYSLVLCSCNQPGRYVEQSRKIIHECKKGCEIYELHWKSDSIYSLTKWQGSLPIWTDMMQILNYDGAVPWYSRQLERHARRGFKPHIDRPPVARIRLSGYVVMN